MEIYELTLKQYQKQELENFKNSKYWNSVLKMTKERKENFIKSKLEDYKRKWYDVIIEYGRENRLLNKVIYSFDKEYGRDHLLHCFRGERKGLIGWINSDAIGF
ncbi:MAG: hypothetical protein WC108_08320 [Bacteroidales bacterium]